MKATEFANFLGKFALQLRELRAYEYANAVSEFSRLFQESASKSTVDAVLKSLKNVDPQTVQRGDFFEKINSALKVANLTLNEFGKPALAKDIQSTVNALQPFRRADFADLLRILQASKLPKKSKPKAPIRDELVACYNDRLVSALSDESEFKAIFAELKVDKKLLAEELKRLAKLFRGEAVRSGPAALAAIWARHESLLDANARTRASSGRSAA
jgi:hypothetical protein